jgi:sigma-E factor negative regulatory protein RseB
MMAVKRFLVVMLLSTGIVSAQEPELNALQLLMKMNLAMDALNYEGTVAFFRNGKLEPMRYVHAAENGLQQERLTSLNSPLREIIRNAGKVSCVFKESNQTIVDHRPFERSFLVDMPDNLDKMGDIYQFEIVGEENIAMLPSYVVAIQPKDNDRYSRKIWIEKQQFLPLKVVVYDNSGDLLEQVVFTDIEVKDTLPFIDGKSIDADYSARHIHQIQPQSSEQAAFVVMELPKGFREVFFARQPMHNAEQPVEHLLLSDGFTSVSLYMENKSAAIQPSIQSAGAVNSYSRVIDNYQLTVMGEVPAETVKSIAEGVKLRDLKN